MFAFRQAYFAMSSRRRTYVCTHVTTCGVRNVKQMPRMHARTGLIIVRRNLICARVEACARTREVEHQSGDATRSYDLRGVSYHCRCRRFPWNKSTVRCSLSTPLCALRTSARLQRRSTDAAVAYPLSVSAPPRHKSYARSTFVAHFATVCLNIGLNWRRNVPILIFWR